MSKVTTEIFIAGIENFIDEYNFEKMLSVSGTNSSTNKTVSVSSESQGSSKNEKAANKKNSNEILGSVSNNMSTRERVQRFINGIKLKREIKKESNSTKGTTVESQLKNNGASFQNRFLAQKNIIEMQRSRLMEQEKMINELKMGILTKDDIRKNDKYEISELFHDCRMKLLGKVPLDYLPKNDDLLVKTQSAPKIVQELERRALERMKYREIIKERRKILEETKKQLQEENLRKKHQMEEEERLKNLEMLNERHRKEQERMKMRLVNKEAYLRNLNKAVLFYENKLLNRTFSKWKSEYISSLNKFKMSEEYYKRKVLEKNFKILLDIVYSKYLLKCEIADGFLRKVLLRKSWQGFKKNHLDGIRMWQVAEDFNDLRIERKVLRCLYGYITKEKILRDIKLQQACYHHRRKLLFSSFFHWKSLPLVLKMEKVKEERKQKWRMKVLEILPDFTPSEL